MPEVTTVVHDGEGAAEAVPASVVDAVGDAREALAHAEHHAEDLATHETDIETLKSRIAYLENSAMNAPQTVDHEAREEIRVLKEELAQAKADAERVAIETDHVEKVEAPDPAPEVEPTKKKSGVREFFRRLI